MDNVLTLGVSLPPSMQDESPNAVRTTLRELSDKLNTTPGVHAVSFSAGAVPLQSEDDLFFWLEGQPKPASQSEMNMVLVYRVEPGYLQTMGIPLKRGRFFTNQDDERSQNVVVIDEVFAHRYFGDTDPVGKRIAQEDPRLIRGSGIVAGERWSLWRDFVSGGTAYTGTRHTHRPGRAKQERAASGTGPGNENGPGWSGPWTCRGVWTNAPAGKHALRSKHDRSSDFRGD
jgi:MacB-like periplasmic core domain